MRGAQTVLTAAAAARVGRTVLVTSAMVYGARPDNPVPLAEDAPLPADADSSVAGDLLEIEQVGRRSPGEPGHGGDRGAPAALVGRAWTRSSPGISRPAAAHREGLRAALAVCHVDNLVSALEFTVVGGVDGAARWAVTAGSARTRLSRSAA